MTIAAKRGLPFVAFAAGTILAIAITILTFTFANPPQCASDMLPEDNNCIIGANIGLGLYLFLAVGVWIIGNVAAVWLGVRNICAMKANKRLKTAWSLGLVLAAVLVTYFVVSFFLGAMSDFVSE